jgi:hypothetical protein
MRVLRRHRFVLAFLAILTVCSAMILQQFMANQSAHAEMREDFILLHTKGHTKPAERLYQLLVQSLPTLPGRAVLDDYQRTVLLVDPKTPQLDNLVWKYHWAVRQELEKRSERRVARALKQAGQE